MSLCERVFAMANWFSKFIGSRLVTRVGIPDIDEHELMATPSPDSQYRQTFAVESMGTSDASIVPPRNALRLLATEQAARVETDQPGHIGTRQEGADVTAPPNEPEPLAAKKPAKIYKMRRPWPLDSGANTAPDPHYTKFQTPTVDRLRAHGNQTAPIDTPDYAIYETPFFLRQLGGLITLPLFAEGLEAKTVAGQSDILPRTMSISRPQTDATETYDWLDLPEFLGAHAFPPTHNPQDIPAFFQTPAGPTAQEEPPLAPWITHYTNAFGALSHEQVGPVTHFHFSDRTRSTVSLHRAADPAQYRITATPGLTDGMARLIVLAGHKEMGGIRLDTEASQDDKLRLYVAAQTVLLERMLDDVRSGNLATTNPELVEIVAGRSRPPVVVFEDGTAPQGGLFRPAPEVATAVDAHIARTRQELLAELQAAITTPTQTANQPAQDSGRLGKPHRANHSLLTTPSQQGSASPQGTVRKRRSNRSHASAPTTRMPSPGSAI